ncbi:HNH endonuclease [Streptomyces alfalfae]
MAWRRATPADRRGVAPGFSRLSVEERFWNKVDRSGGPAACWPWKSSKDRKGYGQFHVSVERGRVPAHTFAVEMATGEPCPPGHEGCHRCDNPPCCNPNHVYYGTRKQNVADTWAHGRGRRGSRHSKALLDEAAVLSIRQRFASGETTPALAAQFGVSDGCITSIVLGRSWKHVGGPIRTHGRPGRRPRKEAA